MILCFQYGYQMEAAILKNIEINRIKKLILVL